MDGIDLKSGGSGIQVCQENLEEYVQLLEQFYLEQGKPLVKSFQEGFYEIFPE